MTRKKASKKIPKSKPQAKKRERSKAQKTAVVEPNKKGSGQTPVDFDENRVTAVFVAKVLGISAETIRLWTKSGCPRNGDRSYSVPEVFRWREHLIQEGRAEKRPMRALEEQKLKRDIRLKELQIQKREGEVISIDQHRAILANRITSLRRFWEDSFIKNIYHFAHKGVEDLVPLAKEFVKQAIDAYIQGSKSVENPG
jgi:hypothetical protein